LAPYSGLKEVIGMTWETPTFVEVKMDAEVNSYQEDYEGI
jgi:coenzyme PQQ precursor peptide PqqA